MLTSENSLQKTQSFRKLKSKQFSLKKNNNTKQTLEKMINFGHYTLKQEHNSVQVSQFKLHNGSLSRQLKTMDFSVTLDEIQSQMNLNQLQVNINKSLMKSFRKQFNALTTQLQGISRTNQPSSLKEKTKISPFEQNQQNQIGVESYSNQVSTNNVHNGNSTANDQFDQKVKSIHTSQTKINSHLRQSAEQTSNQNTYNFSNKIYLNEDHALDERKSSLEIHNDWYQSGFQPSYSKQKSPMRLNNNSLQLSPQSKQFTRSSQFDKFHLQHGNDQPQLSLISSEKSSHHKNKLAVDCLFEKLANDSKVLVYNKLIFLEQDI